MDQDCVMSGNLLDFLIRRGFTLVYNTITLRKNYQHQVVGKNSLTQVKIKHTHRIIFIFSCVIFVAMVPWSNRSFQCESKYKGLVCKQNAK